MTRGSSGSRGGSSAAEAAAVAVPISQSQGSLPASTPIASTPTAVVLLDDAGFVTRIVDRSPRAVLSAFCSQGAGHAGRTAVEIRPPKPYRRDFQVGVFSVNGRRHALWIRRDPDAREWFAGTGLKPIETEPLAEGS